MYFFCYFYKSSSSYSCSFSDLQQYLDEKVVNIGYNRFDRGNNWGPENKMNFPRMFFGSAIAFSAIAHILRNQLGTIAEA